MNDLVESHRIAAILFWYNLRRIKSRCRYNEYNFTLYGFRYTKIMREGEADGEFRESTILQVSLPFHRFPHLNTFWQNLIGANYLETKQNSTNLC